MRNPLPPLILVLGLGVLALGSSGVAAETVAPNALSVVADSGVITLGPNQLLRVTVVNGGGGQGAVSVRFREITYSEGVCNGPVCIHPVASQNTYGLLTLTGGAAASFEIFNTAYGVRGVVSSDTPGLKVLAEVIDATTNQIILMNTEGDAPSLEFQPVGLRRAGQPQ
jgi:hypothetical protein